MGSNQYWAGRVYDLCVYFMTGTPKGSTESKKNKQKNFVAFPWVVTSTGLVEFMVVCVFYDGNI